MNEKLNKFNIFLEKHNINLSPEIINKFEKFENHIKEFNTHTNLLSSNDINLIYEKHFTDSLAFLKVFSPSKSAMILDIGSGGGFPIIPIAIIMKNSKIFSIDSTKKKVDFLNNSANIINLDNFLSINIRAEEMAYDNNFREKFDYVTARAVGNLALISELAIPYLKIGGKFIAYKSTKVQEEIDLAQNTISILGGKIIDIIEYNLDLPENYTRNLVVIEKIKSTEKIYPRSYNLIKAKPL